MYVFHVIWRVLYSGRNALVWLMLCLLTPAVNSAEPVTKPLIFGLLPSESAVTKFKRYAPLRDYLARRLQRPVVLETARDFNEFSKRTSERRYDFVETAPHFVPPAIDSGHYVVLTTIVQPLSAKIVVLESGPHRKLRDLAGRKIATPSEKAIITKIGKATLTAAGLTGRKVPVYETYKTHNAAYEAVLGKTADAAVISINIFNKARRLNKPLLAIGESTAIPNMSILAAKDLPVSLRQTLQAELVNMVKEPEGKKVLKLSAYPGYRKADRREFDVLRAYLQQ